MNANPLYELKYRQVGKSLLVRVVSHRGTASASSSEKVIPPIIEYDKNGNFRLVGAKEVLSQLPVHPYVAKSSDFSVERIADVQVHDLIKGLENFPTLPKLTDGTNHQIAELIYGSMVYFKPTPDLQTIYKKIGYLKKSKLLPEILEKVAFNFHKQYPNLQIDLFSVPKKKVGTYAYFGDNEGYCLPAKTLSMGYHKAIPSDRLARELSSLKACETFSNVCQSLPGSIPDNLKPYITMVRVAVISPESSMLDGADLYNSSIPKIACKLVRQEVVKDVSLVPLKDRNLQFKPFRSGVDVVHINNNIVNEIVEKPGAIRLIFPGGIKVAAQLQEGRCIDIYGEDIDVVMDFDTFAKKGAIATLSMLQDDNYETEKTLDECINVFENMSMEDVWINGVKHQAYIGMLPVMRPGQRYTELSKGSNDITVDLIAKAITGKRYIVKQHIEDQYKELKDFRYHLRNELMELEK